jgi:hypothetical protein
MTAYSEDIQFNARGKKRASAIQNLRSLRATFYLAQEVGEGMGRSQVLQRRMPKKAVG